MESVDSGSYAFRYPTKKDGKTGSLERHFRFNLFEFCERLDPVFPLLAGAAYGAGEELQNLYEQEAEARDEALYDDPIDDPY